MSEQTRENTIDRYRKLIEAERERQETAFNPEQWIISERLIERYARIIAQLVADGVEV